MPLISKEEIEEIKKIKGEVIGVSFREDLDFMLKKGGRKGLQKLEEEMIKLGHPVKLEEINNFQRYPFYLSVLILLIYKKIFQWDDEVFRENGRFGAKVSIIAKIMIKHFISLKRCFEEAGKFWQKYFTAGELRTEELNEKDRYAYLILKEFTGHPLFCLVLEGYIWQVVSYVVPKENLKVQEVECVFKESKYHKFKVTW